jgi:signal transduction histidine kinase
MCRLKRSANAVWYNAGMHALHWLRKRLLPSDQSVMLYAAYAIILTALLSFALLERSLPPWRYYSTLLALSALFVLQVIEPDLQAKLGETRSNLIFAGGGGALFLLANGLGLHEGPTFLPFLLFMLVSQGVVTLGIRWGIIYGFGLTLSWFLVIWLRGASLESLAANLVNISLGLVFTLTFSIVLVRYAEQTQRAEALASELRRANAALEEARGRERDLATAEERVRLARDIHDGLGHHLTALNVQLQAASRLLERDPQRAAAALATSREVAQAALDEVRQSVAAMRRSPLDGRSLPEALAALVDEFSRNAALPARFVQHGALPELAPATAMTLYRTAQEGLTNARKHAAASQVEVQLAIDAERVQLNVINNGPHIAASQSQGFGLAGLRERAELLGGEFSAAPAAEGGFALRVALPIGGYNSSLM